MNKNNFTSFFVVLLLAASGAGIFAQSTSSSAADKYLISARAGGINFIQGPVAVVRNDGTGGSLLRGDRLDIGDVVSTGATAKAEVLLNPGSYMRVSSGAEFEFVTTDLDDLKVKLNRGTAIFEVFATDDFRVTVLTPMGRASMIESGVYRFDVRADGSATVAVTEGKAQLGDSEATIVKSGRVGNIGNSLSIAKFDKKKRDEIDEWSRSRAKELAKVTASLKQKDIRASLINSFRSNRWGMYDSFGLWIYNPYFGAYSFLPFGNRWYSPYGYGFGWGMNWGSIPWWYRVPNAQPGGTTGTSAQPAKQKRRAIDAPPYTAVERHNGRRVRVDSPQEAWPTQRSGSVRGASPGFTPAVPAPVQSQPAARPAQKTRPID